VDYVNLGKTGLKVSRIGLSCMTYGQPATTIRTGSHGWALNEEESQSFLRQSLDLGINFFNSHACLQQELRGYEDQSHEW
jgi:aryl-alcohol dehydrogenase-like predicted oxidoreductase